MHNNPAPKRMFLGVAFGLAIASLAGCDWNVAPPSANDQTPTVGPESEAAFPDLPAGQEIEPGVTLYSVTLQGKEDALWIYLPQNSGEELLEEGSLPCVLIAPAGSYGFLGMYLTESDRPEHLPYVREGFAVVAYAFDGYANPQEDSTLKVVYSARKYVQTDGSFNSARTALEYVLEKVPAIDEQRIFAAGHSSAGTIALCTAAREPRIRACAAYAPGWTDLQAQLHPEIVQLLSGEIPNYGDFLARNSPATYVEQYKVPLFIFHATDDSMVPIRQTSLFIRDLRNRNADLPVTYVTATSGDHYDSMLHEGVPQAIEWMRNLPAEKKEDK